MDSERIYARYQKTTSFRKSLLGNVLNIDVNRVLPEHLSKMKKPNIDIARPSRAHDFPVEISSMILV